MNSGNQVEVSRITRRQSLHANVIRACANCGAPGFWHNTPGVNVGCYAPEKVTKLGEDFVGTTCPNCGKKRADVEHLGEIWSKRWVVGVGAALKGAVQDFWEGFTRQRKDRR